MSEASKQSYNNSGRITKTEKLSMWDCHNEKVKGICIDLEENAQIYITYKQLESLGFKRS